jgi:hypothetical protein
MTLCIVSNDCPVGCGVPVVILQACATNALFCFCDLCGCAWSTPAEAKFDAGLNDITGPEHFAPAGVAPISRSQLTHPAWLDAVIAELRDTDWTTSVNDINAGIVARIASARPL